MSAIGAVAGSIATFLAAFIALYLGLREHRIKVYTRGVFVDAPDMPRMENHPNCFEFDCVNTGNVPVYLSYVMERARFSKTPRGLLCFIESLFVKRRVLISGRRSMDVCKGKYWMAFYMNDVLRLSPGESGKLRVPFSDIQREQLERKRLGVFQMNETLIAYFVDISGRKFRVDLGATPSSFVEEKTCHMVSVSSLTGEIVSGERGRLK